MNGGETVSKNVLGSPLWKISKYRACKEVNALKLFLYTICIFHARLSNTSACLGKGDIVGHVTDAHNVYNQESRFNVLLFANKCRKKAAVSNIRCSACTAVASWLGFRALSSQDSTRPVPSSLCLVLLRWSSNEFQTTGPILPPAMFSQQALPCVWA